MLDFGMEHPGTYMKSKQEGLKDHSKHYPSSNTNDEMAWGAIWIHIATGVRATGSMFQAAAASCGKLCSNHGIWRPCGRVSA